MLGMQPYVDSTRRNIEREKLGSRPNSTSTQPTTKPYSSWKGQVNGLEPTHQNFWPTQKTKTDYPYSNKQPKLTLRGCDIIVN